MILNKIPDDSLRGADRLLAWLLLLFGYTIVLGLVADPSGWDDPVFNVLRRMPYTPYSWALLLAVFTSIHALGELSNDTWKWRGRIVIFGSFVCMAWFLAMGLGMSRMVYALPGQITALWPLVMLFVAALYGSRIIIYANAFTGIRWNTNPYQLWCTLFLLIVSLTQVIIGVAPASVFTEIERPSAIQVSLANFVGASIVMFGLHLKNKNAGLNLEMWGAISLLATLIWYVVAVMAKQKLAGATLGFGMIEAVVFATLHRSLQICTLKYALWRDKPRLANRVSSALHSELPALTEPSRREEPKRHGR